MACALKLGYVLDVVARLQITEAVRVQSTCVAPKPCSVIYYRYMSMYVYMYIYTYMYTYVYIYIYVYVHIYI